MRWIWAWSCGVVLLAGCAGQTLLTLEVPREEIQKKLEEKFPISPEGEGGEVPFKLTLSEPAVSLQETDNRIVLTMKLDAALEGGSAPDLPDVPMPELPMPDLPAFPPGPPGAPGLPTPPQRRPAKPQVNRPVLPKSLSGKLVISGSPEFDLKERALYIRDARVDQLNVDGLPPPLNGPILQVVQEKVAERFDTTPIPVPSDPSTDWGKALVKRVSVGAAAVKIELGF